MIGTPPLVVLKLMGRKYKINNGLIICVSTKVCPTKKMKEARWGQHISTKKKNLKKSMGNLPILFF